MISGKASEDLEISGERHHHSVTASGNLSTLLMGSAATHNGGVRNALQQQPPTAPRDHPDDGLIEAAARQLADIITQWIWHREKRRQKVEYETRPPSAQF